MLLARLHPSAVKTLQCGIVSAALLFGASSAFAGNPAPNVQILVKKGGLTAFKGLTDGEGKFNTAALEPGIYQFEVRGPKIVGPARYFLALAGARPVGETMTNADGDLAMQAEVKRLTSVRGQVRATRVLRLPAPTPPESVATSAPVAAVPGRGFASGMSRATSGPTAYRAPGQAATAPRANLPGTSQVPAAAPRTAIPNGRAAASASPAIISIGSSPIMKPRIIEGKRYLWVPTTSGSRLGRWVLDPRQPRVNEAAPRAAGPGNIERGR